MIILQDGQIFLNLVFRYLYPVLVVLYFLIFDEGMKQMVAQSFFNQRALFRQCDGLGQVAGSV
jgi:hypothetical protein